MRNYSLYLSTVLLLVCSFQVAEGKSRSVQSKEMPGDIELRSERTILNYVPENKESSQVVACRYAGVDETVTSKCQVGKVNVTLGYDKVEGLLHEKRYVQSFLDVVQNRDLAREENTVRDIRNRVTNELEGGLRRLCLEQFEKDTGIRPDASFVKVFAPARTEKSDQSIRTISLECTQEPVTLFSRPSAQ
jgi:hypothetical protein